MQVSSGHDPDGWIVHLAVAALGMLAFALGFFGI